jgi:eukaryotic-like serine/threonine-protein kinase
MDRERLAHYRIISRLGAGGMGEVYQARDEHLERDVAVKVLPATSFDDPTARARLVREARAAAALNHPNICTVYEVGEADGQAYIAMELVEGRTLSELLLAGPLPPEQVVHYGCQLAEALIHAHERGVVHRDLKSNNVLVTGDRRVKVLDFGLAKRAVDSEMTAAVTQMHASLTQAGTAVGTLPYMSPEQLRGEPVGVASDIWALGVVLYEMATGTRPFTGSTPFELSAAILSDAPIEIPAQINTDVRMAIAGCLVRDSKQRYARASDVRARLTGLMPGPDRAAPFPPTPAAVRPDSDPVLTVTVTRRRALGIAGLVVLATALGFTGWRLMSGGGTATRTLAVLPLSNVANDEDLEYLCDGIAGRLIEQISTLASFRVKPLTTVLTFKGKSEDPLEAGRQLGVQTVLAGTLELRDTRLQISGRLLDVATGRQLWASSYDRAAADLLDVQDEIASAIMDDGLRVRLTTAERARLVRHPTNNGDAFDLYLQARYHQRGATEDGYLYSLELLNRAIARDPNFALAYGSMSGNYAMLVTDGLMRPTDAWPLVGKYANQAARLDPDLVDELEAYEHARAFLFDWDWEGAARARERFMQNPVGEFDPQLLRAMAAEHWALGRRDEALQLAKRTRELDPRSPYLAVLEADYLLQYGQYDAAIALYEHATRLEPESPNGLFGLAEARARQGRFDEAIEARRRAHAVAGDDVLASVLAAAKGEQGYRAIERAWVQVQLGQLKERAATGYVSPLDFARVYAQLGEADLAFKHLEEAFEDRAPGLVFLKVDRAWDAVRKDARFETAVRRVGLP